MFSLIMAACGAAGAVIGALTTKATHEKDKQAVKRYEKVNAELIDSRDKLEQRYYELSDRSKKQITEVNLKLAESEMEKDALHLAVRLQNELIFLMEAIDINPTLDILLEFKKAVVLTNNVLQKLDEKLVPVNQDYFNRSLNRIGEKDNLSEEQLIDFRVILTNPKLDNVNFLLDKVQNETFTQQNTNFDENDNNYLETDCIKEPATEYKKNEFNDLFEDYKLKLEYLEHQKEREVQFKLELQRIEIQANIEKEKIELEKIKVRCEEQKSNKEKEVQFKLELQRIEIQANIEKEKIELEKIKIYAKQKWDENEAKSKEQQLKRETKLAQQRDRAQQKQDNQEIRAKKQQLKRETKLAQQRGASHFFTPLIFVFCQVRKNLIKKAFSAMTIITHLHKWDAPQQRDRAQQKQDNQKIRAKKQQLKRETKLAQQRDRA
jgi:hypothetical protein